MGAFEVNGADHELDEGATRNDDVATDEQVVLFDKDVIDDAWRKIVYNNIYKDRIVLEVFADLKRELGALVQSESVTGSKSYLEKIVQN